MQYSIGPRPRYKFLANIEIEIHDNLFKQIKKNPIIVERDLHVQHSHIYLSLLINISSEIVFMRVYKMYSNRTDN